MTTKRPQVLAALIVGFAILVTSLAAITASPAQAATIRKCDGVMGHAAGYGTYHKVPVRRYSDGSGTMRCYMDYGTTGKEVAALQRAIVHCYPASTAATYIKDHGGVDGKYYYWTARAVRWIQAYRLGFSGGDVDGVYGPMTRNHIKWPEYWLANGKRRGSSYCSRY